MEIKTRAAVAPNSYEQLCHATGPRALHAESARPRRAVRSEGSRQGHVSNARSASSTGPKPSSRATTSRPSLPRQFDEYIWFDDTQAVTPLAQPRIVRDCRTPIRSGCDPIMGQTMRPPTFLTKMDWMRVERIWPNGLRYLWTDAFGLVLLVSLYAELGDRKFLDQAEWLVARGRPGSRARSRHSYRRSARSRRTVFSLSGCLALRALRAGPLSVRRTGAKASISCARSMAHLSCRAGA